MTSPFLLAEATSHISIIVSKGVHQSFGFGLAFRGWIYATTTISLTPKHLFPNSNSELTACLNTGYGVTFVNKCWLLKHLSTSKINIMSTPMKVREIGVSKHKSEEFAALSLYLSGKTNTGHLVYTSLTCEIHLVKDLKANLLVGTDIISPEGFVIDVKGKSAFIESYGVTVPINAR